METTPIARPRVRLIAAALALAATAALPFSTQAAGYPERPINLIVPFSPGGGTDISARLLAVALTEKLAASVVVDNRPGAGGQIAADLVARSPADGYTLLFANSGMLAINPWIYKLHSDPATAFAPVSLFSDLPFVLVVPTTLPAKNVADLVTLAKAEPGKHTFASSGTGGAPHLSGEIFQQATGVDLMHVPYKGGGPAMTDLMAGRVDMLFASVLETMPYVTAGKLRALAVTGDSRSPAMPDVPTIDEAGVKNAQSGSWTAVLAPAGTPPAVIEKLSQAIRDVANDPAIKTKLESQGAVAHGSTPQQLQALAASERARYGQIIKTRNIQTN
ncbi:MULTISPECIES: tripartite tricarboxylate transporter substrate binding protein [Achromobacter]|uniref:Tripartite tricarboxylate transporter substrate binding protein n=2 Tax=Achromobacter spanius TaxID=217203 RepID=A0AA42IU51_9BURK|nr:MULTISPECIES: tripartite tricarboxylate transporter substrate binding protein [Achromobacter]MCS3505233.1 tripartite-type tricarboxylate transporter receptor subunit TctC [Achromobacter sp. JUb104]MDH0735064.1 tripartite tricarboxylate transporter substrate binding protein [Achromobacter spanius]